MTADQIQSLYNQINAYILGHFEMFWTIIIGVFAIIGVALYFVVKSIIAKGITDEAEKQHRKYVDLESRIDQIRASSLRYHPTEYDLPLAEGIEKMNSCCYSKNCDDLVVVTISVKASNGELKSGIHTIATLPAGFKSGKVISQTISDSLSIRIFENGSICYDSKQPLKDLSYSSILFYASTK